MEINKIYNESNLETMAKMPDNFVDLVVTSPPYDNLRTYTGESEWTFELFKKIANELFRVVKEGGVVVWVVGDATIKGSETGTSFRQALYFKEVGFNLHDTMIYQKQPQGAVGNNKGYWQSFEYMFVFSKGNISNINLIIDRENKYPSKKHFVTNRKKDGSLESRNCEVKTFGRRTNIWYYPTGTGHSTKDKGAFKHPAIFPEQLANDHIISWSNEEDLVYDPFLGSGTTAKMAILNNRNFIGSEISEEYCKIAQERINKTIQEKQSRLF